MALFLQRREEPEECAGGQFRFQRLPIVATFRTAMPRMTPLSPRGPAANNLDFSNKAPKLPTCSLCILLTSSRVIAFVLSRAGPVLRKTQVIGAAVALFVRKARASRRAIMTFLMCLDCLRFRARFFKLLKWWLRAELNRRHKDFQSSALPTELPSHAFLALKDNPTLP